MHVDSKSRLNALLDLAERTLAGKETDTGTIPRQRVNAALFAEFRSGGLALIVKNFGEQHPFFSEFDSRVRTACPKDVEYGKGILKAVKAELETH
ncbi:MAG: hypothetical protein HYZ14_17710 [Bacteroidetes bacterium]|nr:hypothetical protein [Bacteroidota bacterium]